jgi:hypothetical protein
LEISALVQHGYTVARQVVREAGLVSAERIPSHAPWNPLGAATASAEEPATVLSDQGIALDAARRLQRSSSRRTVSTLLDFHDWPTYVWLPLLLVLIFTVPSLIIQSRRTARQQANVLSAVSRSSPLYSDVLEMLRSGPTASVPVLSFEEVESVEPLDFSGYDVISDDRIYDLRRWRRGTANRFPPLMHARFRIRRSDEAAEQPRLRIQLPSNEEEMHAEYLPRALRPQHVRARREDGLYVFETSLDFSRIPVDSDTALVVRQLMPINMARQELGGGWFKFTIAADTGLVRIWVLLPEGRPHDQFHLFRYPIDDPTHVEFVEATRTVELPVASIATFELINPVNDYRYECRWRWLDVDEDEVE